MLITFSYYDKMPWLKQLIEEIVFLAYSFRGRVYNGEEEMAAGS